MRSFLPSQPLACTTDANGQLLATYTAPLMPPGQGLVDIRAASAPGGASIVSDIHYVYCTVYRFAPSPIAPSGTLAAAAEVATTVSADTASDVAVPNAAVDVSFTPTSGGGHAAAGTTALNSTPTLLHVDSSGHLQVTYTAPTSLPSAGVDSIVIQDKPSSPTSSTTDSYAFSTSAPVISIGDASVVEAHVKPGIPLRNTLTLSAPQPTPVTVQYTTQCGLGDKTCSEDFKEVHTPVTVTFPAQTTHATIIVRIYSYTGSFGGEDYNENYFVHLSNPSGAVLGRSIAELTVLPNASASQLLYIGDASLVPIAAAGTPVGFTVSLTAPQGSPITFTYATSDGTAIAGVDYAAASATGPISAGSNSAVIYIQWLAQRPPPSNWAFSLTISNVSGGVAIGRATGTGTILAG